ncbi:MAG: ABC transporter substrate-binding protein [Candidatus Saccharibacteria bacterium]
MPGGIYNEGIVGTYSNANPIYATGAVDTAVSRLIFAGLMQYNDQNQLVGDLASGMTVDATGKHYTVTLKPGLTWQDGAPLTADDVAFTYHLIQNPDVGSPLLQSWQNITVTADNKLTVSFTLPNAFAAFPYNLVGGIVPEHILKDVPASQMRAATFNTTAPVGAGAFAWQAIQTNTATDPDKTVSLIALKPFAHYAGGAPKLDGYVLRAFGGQDAMVSAFQKRDINAMAGLDSVPAGLGNKSGVDVTSFPSTAALMTFFKTSGGVLADVQVRQALVQGADTSAIVSGLGYVTKPVREPLLRASSATTPNMHRPAMTPRRQTPSWTRIAGYAAPTAYAAKPARRFRSICMPMIRPRTAGRRGCFPKIGRHSACRQRRSTSPLADFPSHARVPHLRCAPVWHIYRCRPRCLPLLGQQSGRHPRYHTVELFRIQITDCRRRSRSRPHQA